MVTLLAILHVLVTLVLILVVLLQSSRGTDLAGAFGGGGSQTAFGPRGTSNFLSKTTAVLAGIFMLTSLSLSLLSNRGRKSGSVLSGEKSAPVSQQKAPAQPLPGTQSAPGGPKIQVIPVQPGSPNSSVPPAQPPAQSAPAPESGGAAPAPPAGK